MPNLFLPLLLLSGVPLGSSQPGEVFIPACDPRFVYNGRSQINPDGSRSFDWEGVSITLTVSNTRYMKAQFTTTYGTNTSRTKIVCDVPSATGHVNFSQGFSNTEICG